jgi:Tfp pilus assembly protein PilV
VKKQVSIGATNTPTAGRQQGATLIIGLIMLVLISVIVLNAYNLSSSNLKSVGNMQMRQEAVAAANQAVERLIEVSTNAPFTKPRSDLSAQTFAVDINKDGITDYSVVVAVPTCLRALKASSALPSDEELKPAIIGGSEWNTEWDIDATVTDAASGTSVHVRQGLRVLLADTDKANSCP